MVSKSESFHLVNKISDESIVGIIRLSSEKQEYKIRLINPGDIKVAFSITLDPPVASVTIKPAYGKIKPRDFANVVVTDDRTNQIPSKTRLKLNYYWRDRKRSKSFAIKTIFIGIEREYAQMNIKDINKAEGYGWLLLKLLRSSLLAILIAYNVIIIKVYLYG